MKTRKIHARLSQDKALDLLGRLVTRSGKTLCLSFDLDDPSDENSMCTLEVGFKRHGWNPPNLLLYAFAEKR